MAEALSQSADSNTPKALKDKNCPFCGQAFTSSSLGRHLDLYIRERNPKPPDGLHDVVEIRKLRGNITRRQPRGSLARRATSTPTGTPAASVSRKSPVSDDGESSNFRTPAPRNESAQAEESRASRFPFITPWEATGVINDIPRNGEPRRSEGESPSWLSNVPPQPQRAASRQMQKVQLDMKQKMQDAMDTARAAELALREVIGSWRAAKQHLDMHSMPFDFEPLALDFPALTLQCLEPPPTLFSSTQHPTPSSWSISPPGHQQFEALRIYFAEEFRKWRITCEAVTTAVDEDLPYPPSAAVLKTDGREAAIRALRVAESLETQVNNHIQTTYNLWEALPAERRSELWVLELARNVGKKQHAIDRLKETQHSLQQETASLKSQVEHLNRLQQPREFKILSPTTVPIGQDLVAHMQREAVVHGRRTLGLSINDRHSDLGTVVSGAVERWKNIIVSTRSNGGLNAQRPLEQADSTAPSQAGSSSMEPNDGNGTGVAVNNTSNTVQSQTPQSQHRDPPGPSSNGPTYTNPSTSTGSTLADRRPAPGAPGTQPPSGPIVTANAGEDDTMSDQDADAEMEYDDNLGFSAMNTSTRQPNLSQHQQHRLQLQAQAQTQARQQSIAMPAQQTVQLDVPRTRGGAQQRLGTNGVPAVGKPYAANAAHGNPGVCGGMDLSRSASPMNAAGQGRGAQQQTQLGSGAGAGHGHERAAHADMGMPMQGVGGGDPMYTD